MLNTVHLELLKNKIDRGHFPKIHPHFAGANLIITDNPNRKFEDGDILILSEFAGPISWLIEQLRDIFVEKLDYYNKFKFYEEIGIILTRTLNDKEKDLFGCLNDVIAEVEANWN